MTVTNHILAGSLIGITIKEPTIALPLALSSHFLMDALPHFGYKGNNGYGEALKHRMTYLVGIGSVVTSGAVIALLLFSQPWVVMLAGAIAAVPDILGIYNYRKYERLGKKATGVLKIVHVQFHRSIQRYERPWGVYVEIIMFIVLFGFLVSNL